MADIIQKAFHKLNKIGKKIFGDNDVYVGYGSNSGPQVYYGQSARQKMGTPTGQRQNNGGKPNAYSRTSAKTARDINQGGMTKDEILQWNVMHPNEIAGQNTSGGTALNTNTSNRG